MISVFFFCSSPYIGFRLLQADYVQEKMVECSEKEMTPTGYKLFNTSGSYMLLGTVHNRKYFHSCETQAIQYDEQGRPINNSVAFLAGSAEDAPIINDIAAYVFFNEDAFYAEMAKYITLLDDGYTVDFKALAAFLKRFERGCQIQARSPEAERFFKEIQSSNGHYDIDFIVRQSTWNYFVNQVGRDFTRNEKYNMSDTQGAELASQGTVVFKQPKVIQKPEPPVLKPEPPVLKPEPPAPKQEPVKEAVIPAANEDHKRELQVLQSDCNAKAQLLAIAEKKAGDLLAEVTKLKETIRKSFWLGLVVGIIGTAIVVLIHRLLS